MRAGDLVRIKYDGKVSIVTEVETEHLGVPPSETIWVHLHNERMVFKAEKLEVINESR